ncbi:DUF3486 family protein [Aeromonas allosaccharophila]|uniref:DUF3486 family protein n=1 Tax=Aeromonas allosaccharophila TaxID=656 RepID=UPI001F33C25A|nr:DUF3486 family protein [Aeromonas allosaccharophila]MCE9848389.1 DUF3486 family protein [Aeromonas allosaccharophila]
MTTKKNTKSKIQQLPDDIRSQLAAMLRSGSMSQKSILAEINKLILESGLPPEDQISRTGLNRFYKRTEAAGSRIARAKEMAEVLTSKLGDAPTSQIGNLMAENMKTMAFETSMALMEASEDGEMIDIKQFNQLALAMQRISQSSILNQKLEKEIRAAFAAEAATAAEKIVKQAGLTAETAAQIKQQILGIA